MTTSLGYSLIDQTNNINDELSLNIHEQRRKNKTIKNKESNNKVDNILKHLNVSSDNDSDLADFNPPTNPISSGVERTKNTVSSIENFDTASSGEDNDDKDVTKENFQESNGAYAQQYYNQYVPYYSNASNVKDSGGGTNPEIMEKLNYLVNLIEHNNDEKINSVTEELVLYCFLGVFIIFIVDSFAKVGKYVR